MIENNPDALSESKRELLTNELREIREKQFSLERIYEERFGRYEPDEFCGYQKLNLEKVFNAILFLCGDGKCVLKTVLNKLLFYADFIHYREYAVSITGLKYAAIDYGPVPDNYEHYYALLVDNGSLGVEEIFCNDEIAGEKFLSKKNPELSLFSPSELKILASVKEYFDTWTARNISDCAYKEKGYEETPIGRPISYSYCQYIPVLKYVE